jgi:TP901 family phage tail tape measure protein
VAKGILQIKVLGDTSGINRSLDSVGWDKFAKAAGIASAAIAASMGAAGMAVVKTAASFESEMSRVRANASGTAAEMAKLQSTVIQLGKDTVFSAGQTAQAANELVKAGLSVKDTIGALPGMLALASAGELDVAQAAEITANQLSVFNLSAEDATKVADTLALAANRSTTEVSLLGDSLAMAGAVASQAGLTIEETAAALALLANNGLKGSDAGTSLKQMFLQLMGPSEKAADLMASIGFSAYDAGGKMKDMEQIIADLSTATQGMTDKERDFTLATIFGSDAVRAANILLKEGAENYRAMTEELSKSGAAADIAATKMDNLKGSWEQFMGSLETAAIMMGSTGLPGLRELVDGLTQATNEFIEVWERLTGSNAWKGGTFEVKFGLAARTVERFLLDLLEKGSAKLREIDWSGVGETFGETLAGGVTEAFLNMAPQVIPVTFSFSDGPASGAAMRRAGAVASYAAQLRENIFVEGWEDEVRRIAREDGLKLSQAYNKWLASTQDEFIPGITRPTEQQAFNVKRLLGLPLTEAELQRAIELGFDEKLASQLLADQAAKMAAETRSQIEARDDVDWMSVLWTPGEDLTEKFGQYITVTRGARESTDEMAESLSDLGSTVAEVNPFVDVLSAAFSALISPTDAWTTAIDKSAEAAGLAAAQYQTGKDTLVSFLEEMLNQISAWENFQTNLEELAREWGPEFGAEVIMEASKIGPDFVAALVGADDPEIVRQTLEALASTLDMSYDELAQRVYALATRVGANAGQGMAEAWGKAFSAYYSTPVIPAPKASSYGGWSPSYAEGTITTGPEIALIGESGPEVVLPLNDRRRSLELLSRTYLFNDVTSGVSRDDVRQLIAAVERISAGNTIYVSGASGAGLGQEVVRALQTAGA